IRPRVRVAGVRFLGVKIRGRSNDLDQNSQHGRRSAREKGNGSAACDLSEGIRDARADRGSWAGGRDYRVPFTGVLCSLSLVQCVWRNDGTGFTAEEAPTRNDCDDGFGDEPVPLLN